MPRPANSLVIAVDGSAWPVQTEPQVPNLEDIYPLIGATRAEVLSIRPNLDHSAGQRVSAVLDGLDLDFWFGRMSAYEQPQNFVAAVLSQALGGTSSVLHGPIVLQAGNNQTGDSLPPQRPGPDGPARRSTDYHFDPRRHQRNCHVHRQLPPRPHPRRRLTRKRHHD